jgi:hypothetical protein
VAGIVPVAGRQRRTPSSAKPSLRQGHADLAPLLRFVSPSLASSSATNRLVEEASFAQGWHSLAYDSDVERHGAWRLLALWPLLSG